MYVNYVNNYVTYYIIKLLKGHKIKKKKEKAKKNLQSKM